MPTVICKCEGCKHNENGYCGENIITISDDELTAAGFLPQCKEYEEEE